ncbi:uncharacterized protein LOC135208892 [Macrobrachium nipponense]|uniref:uncharacterized protein LOC135208892 n=1 Tax=Macrobrachium nipponense TaxID=159736 RepID=UPI0030C8076A
MFYGQRNAALETQEHVPWVAPDDAEGSDVDVSPLDIDSDDDDPTYVPDEGLTQDDAFDPPNSRARKVNVVVPQAMPMEEEGEPNLRGLVLMNGRRKTLISVPCPTSFIRSLTI